MLRRPSVLGLVRLRPDKPAGAACPNLQADFRCGIHAELRPRGFAGCTVYDCFGAGQQVSQVTFGGLDWRASAEVAARMFAAFPVVRDLHELRWYLAEALTFRAAAEVHPALLGAVEETERRACAGPDELLATESDAHRRHVDGLLLRASELARAEVRPGRRPDHRGADLMGRKLRRADLRAASLRGAYLIGADLRGANLSAADVIGADLRGADVRGADLSGALFLTQFQVNSARGDRATRLPPVLARPGHWA